MPATQFIAVASVASEQLSGTTECYLRDSIANKVSLPAEGVSGSG